MKIGELPHREFSYCFLSDTPKCAAKDTPTGVVHSVLYDMRECEVGYTPSGVASPCFGVVCRSCYLSTGGTRLSPRLPAVIKV